MLERIGGRGPAVNRSTLTTLLCGGAAALMGLLYFLQGAGVVVAKPGHDDERGVAMAIGSVFIAGGAAAMLTTARGLAAKRAVGLLSFVIVVCFAAIGGWVAFGPGERNFASPFAIFGHQANEISGRVLFGFGALLCLTMAVAMARALGPRGAADADTNVGGG